MKKLTEQQVTRREVLERRKRSWEKKASCKDMDTDAFFPSSYDVTKDHIKSIKVICNECPVALACLEYALETEEHDPYGYRWGVSGGLTPKERERLVREIAAGANQL